MQKASQEGYLFLGAQEDFLPTRDKMIMEQSKQFDELLAEPEEVRRAKPSAEPDMNAMFPLEPYLVWLYGYDAIAVAKEYLAGLA